MKKAFLISLILHIILGAFFVKFYHDKLSTNLYHDRKVKKINISLKKLQLKKEVKKEPKNIVKKKPKPKHKTKLKSRKRKKLQKVQRVHKTFVPSIPKQNYLSLNRSKIYEAIQRAKRYPPLAKRLGITGKVQVVFTLHPDGTVSNIQISGAHKILQKSARKTIMIASKEFPKSSEDVLVRVSIGYVLE